MRKTATSKISSEVQGNPTMTAKGAVPLALAVVGRANQGTLTSPSSTRTPHLSQMGRVSTSPLQARHMDSALVYSGFRQTPTTSMRKHLVRNLGSQYTLCGSGLGSGNRCGLPTRAALKKPWPRLAAHLLFKAKAASKQCGLAARRGFHLLNLHLSQV